MNLGKHPEKSEQDFLESIVNVMPLAVYCKDYSALPGRFVAWNRAAERLWGFDTNQVIGKTDFDLFPAQQAEYLQTKDLETLLSSDVQFTPEEQLDSPTNGRRLVRTWKISVPALDGTPRFLLGISLDITEERKLSEGLAFEKQKSLASAKLASLGEMAGGIAHEINNPLTIILGQVELVKIAMSDESVDRRRLLTAIERVQGNAVRIAKIVQGLLRFARDGSLNPMQEASITEVLRDTLTLCEQQIRKHGIDLMVEWPEPDVRIECRDIEISQVVMNLLNNARSAVAHTPKAWIRLVVKELSNHVEISVTDSGTRPPDDILNRLFTPFFTTKPVGQGTGLGLSICRGLIENHHGSIWVDPHCENTRFVIQLPKLASDRKAA